MNNFQFKAVCESDIIFSSTSATTGGHETLDYIPGSAILGWCAGKLYSAMGERAFGVFHGGRIRFGNGYPETEQGEATYPVALSWHLPKSFDPVARNNWATNIIDRLHQTENHGEQVKQVRSGFFSSAGELIHISPNYSQKTAMDRNNYGRPLDEHLFGYESIPAGTTFRFSIEFEEDYTAEAEKVKSALSGKRIFIGRSRNAEYGAVHVTALDELFAVPRLQQSERISLYCFSDLAIIDDCGNPTFTLSPDILNIKDIELVKEYSFIRTRSYSPFNRTRKAYDPERQVVSKGSIFTYKGTTEALKQLSERALSPIGLYTSEGLGKVISDPHFLAPTDKFITSAAQNEKPAPVKNHPASIDEGLEKFLQRKQKEASQTAEAIEFVEEWANKIAKDNRNAPNNSQWAQLRTIATELKDIAQAENRLDQLCNTGVSAKQWCKMNKGIESSCGKFIIEKVFGEYQSDPTKLKKLLYLLGNRVPHKLNQAANAEKGN